MVIACRVLVLLFDVACSEALDLSTEQKRAWDPLRYRIKNTKDSPPSPPKKKNKPQSIIIPLRYSYSEAKMILSDKKQENHY